MATAFEYYEKLPPLAKNILTAVAAVGAFGIGYAIYKKINKGDKTKEGEAAGDALAELAKVGIKPTYQDAQYESFAQGIVAAIDGFGTDESAIYNVMEQLKNLADWYKLVNIYGVREYKGTFEGWFTKIENSLSAALSDELDTSEKEKVNSILSKNGILLRII